MHTTVSFFVRVGLMAGLAGALASACSSSDSGGAGGSGGDGTSGDSCPGATCTWAASTNPGAACLALADNTGKDRIDLRMNQLIVTAPQALTNTFIKKTILGANVRTNYGDPSDPLSNPCNMGQGTDTGGFSWLFSFDTKAGKMITGGGPAVPSAKAGSTTGTCFYRFTDQASGEEVKPTEVPATVGSDGTIASNGSVDLTVPIFLATGGVVLLPLNHVVIQANEKLTSGNNCLGVYDKTLDPSIQCVPDDSVSYFSNGAQLEGYITVKQAEGVIVADLKETLCVLLSGQRGETDANNVVHCPVDGSGVPTVTGDWQSDPAGGPGMSGGNKDSWKLTAVLSASAIKNNGIATKADCSDATWSASATGDAGTPSGDAAAE